MLGKIVDSIGWFLAPRKRMDWKSWRSLVIVSPFVIGVLVTLPQTIREKRTATRQETTQGTVTSYEKSNHNLCGYTFHVQGKRYTGTSSSPTTDIKIGDQVLVYFDPPDPSVNALEDFAAMSRRDSGFVGILLGSIAIGGAFIAIARFTSTRAELGSKST